jgi:hypothetical protein
MRVGGIHPLTRKQGGGNSIPVLAKKAGSFTASRLRQMIMLGGCAALHRLFLGGILQTADGILNLAHGLVGFAFGLQLGIAGEFAGGFLDTALSLVCSACNAILIHSRIPFWLHVDAQNVEIMRQFFNLKSAISQNVQTAII